VDRLPDHDGILSAPGRIRGHDGAVDPIPPEIFLNDYSPQIRSTAERLRRIVRRAVPDAIEAVRPGWRLIGYDVRVGRRTRFFAWIWPESAHVHFGFEHGILLPDPGRILQGAHLKLKKVRYFTFKAGVDVPERVLIDFTRAAANLALLPRAARAGLAAGVLEPVESEPAAEPD
jgi:hypothetical protein